MTEQEQIELLQAVTKCGKQNLCATMDCDHRIDFNRFKNTWLNFEDDDIQNGSAIIALLDAMEKDGELLRIESLDEGDYQVDRYEECEWLEVGYGKTRAEAVAKAFVAVFGKQEE